MTLRRQLDAIANNVANANTTGFRGEEIKFEKLVTGDKDVAFASTGSTYIQRRPGAMVKSDNPLDVAISGEGWLSLQTPNGTVYTRDGRMMMAETGVLQSIAGNPILDAGGSQIRLNPADGPVSISRDGMLTQAGIQVGAIGLFSIDESAKLTRAENSGVIPDRPAIPILDFRASGLVQGFTENSNVNPIMEMSRLVMIQRAFESMTSSMESSENSFNDAIKTLGATT
ncbi:flagellar basal-body rod protein FlgF [Beijerinckia sp. GAS462]|nr:flagellar basal-body rod protein FlgF [Beijerinckia sp. GAS462]